MFPKHGKKFELYSYQSQGVAHMNCTKSFRPINIYSLDYNGKAGGSSYEGGTIKGFPLNPMQHAYLKSKLTETALHNLVYKNDGLRKICVGRLP
jgi:hypothetical protein